MNYFEYYNIPVSYTIDPNLLRRKYYEKSREIHPDALLNSGDQGLAENLSSINNQAYKVLNDSTQRLKHLIEVNKYSIKENSENLDPSFLMEMMDLHEEITITVEANDRNRIHELTEKLELLNTHIHVDALPDLTLIDQNKGDEKSFNNLIIYYYKLKYIARLKQTLNKESAEI